MTPASIPAAILPRVAALVRLLGSDVDGEALGAARALRRTLAGCGADLHALAEAVERPTGSLVVYVERPPARRQSRAEAGHIDWSPAKRAHVLAALERGLVRFPFNEWERDFIGSVIGRLRSARGRLTFRQAEVVERLVAKVESGA